MRKWIESVNNIRKRLNKYVVAIVVFVIVTFFLGDSTLLKRYSYDQKINELEKEIKKYQKEKEQNEEKLKALYTDDESLERFAREEFLMTNPDEELFIIKSKK